MDLDLTIVDRLLTTTRSVRKRLDLRRPVDPALVERAIEVAVQAPTGSNSQGWHFVVVTDATKRARIGELYRRAFEAYVNIISNRVIEFRGLGWAITLGATLVTLNLAYFGLGLTRARGRLWWSVYVVHFTMSLAVGLLSGSRGGTLNIFAMQLFAYHYIKGNIRLSRALPAAAALLACAMVLGVVRNSVKFQDDIFTIGLGDREQTIEYSTFQYGVRPLQLLLDADHLKPAFGMTLVTIVTNVVPRDWWPDKPDTGGVFFTKEYAGNAWNGASNLTPTLLGEGIINFGWVMGIAFYVLTYPVLMYLIVTYYLRIAARARAERSPAAALAVVLYVCVMWSVVGLMTAEVTTILLSLLLTKVAPLWLLQAVLGQSGRTLEGSRGARPAHPVAACSPR